MKVNINDYDDYFVESCKDCETPLDHHGRCPNKVICICGKEFHPKDDTDMCSKMCVDDLNGAFEHQYGGWDEPDPYWDPRDDDPYYGDTYYDYPDER